MRVTKEIHDQIIQAGCYPPRHKRGCPKNQARILPILLAASGMPVKDIKSYVWHEYSKYDCKCKEL